jgi:hypothetical protein
MRIAYRLTPDDGIAFQDFMERSSWRAWLLGTGQAAVAVVIFGLVAMFAFIFWRTSDAVFHAVIFGVCVALALLSAVILPWYIRRHIKRAFHRQLGYQTRPTSVVTFDEAGVHIQSGAGSIQYGWHQIERVVVNGDCLYLFYTWRCAVIVPHRVIGDEPETQRLLAQIAAWRSMRAWSDTIIDQ